MDGRTGVVTCESLLFILCCVVITDLAVVRERAAACTTQLTAVDRFFFAMKSNNNVDVLRAIVGGGFGLECVSLPEVGRLVAALPSPHGCLTRAAVALTHYQVLCFIHLCVCARARHRS